MSMEPVRIGITMGDPSGVGAEIIAKAIVQAEIRKLGKIFVIGDSWVFNKIKNQKTKIKPSTTLRVDGERDPSTSGSTSSPPLEPSRAKSRGSGSSRAKVEGRSRAIKSFQFIDFKNTSHKNFKFGKVKGEFGLASIEYLKGAVELIKSAQIDCLVTAPISKEAINLAGYKYNGHTEFLAKAFNKKKQDLVMMLLNKYLKISLVTRHLPLNKVSSALNKEVIYRNIITTHNALIDYFAIKQPRMCVAALNPHAGEAGLLGKEEIKSIIPAIRKARRIVKEIVGPLPPDTAISFTRTGRFNAVIAMYHDQALIPLKILDFATGVNITLGLDFVRTSPLHGTGFDIAGKNIASCTSLIAAIKTAVECTKNLKKIKGG